MVNNLTWTLRDGGKIPRLGQGTWYLGEKPSARLAELTALRTGIDHGMTLIDTAEMYGDGLSEKLVGEAIAPYNREKLFLVSKVYPWNAGKDRIFKACEDSLRRLNTDYLDLYLLHWRGTVPLMETAECMEELVLKGHIRHWGVSNLDLEDMEELWKIPAGRHCQVDQVLYHLGSRNAETVLLPWLRQHKMALMAYCPLAQGGTLKRQLLSNPILNCLADEKGCTILQLMLAFLLATPESIVIPRTSNAAHTVENAAAASIRLTAEDLSLLNSAFPAPKSPLPLDIV